MYIGGTAMIWVTQAEYLGGFRMRLTFSDRTVGEVDLRDVVHGDPRTLFVELREEKRFCAFRVEMDTVVWENGLDLAPEFLYELAVRRDATATAACP
jgi:hypothetical protein